MHIRLASIESLAKTQWLAAGATVMRTVLLQRCRAPLRDVQNVDQAAPEQELAETVALPMPGLLLLPERNRRVLLRVTCARIV